jgi:hypothetical protein|tara:strand:+ start:558 stop:2288 length:1731 start_codon:yes stop_codon:yes gene_type:complete
MKKLFFLLLTATLAACSTKTTQEHKTLFETSEGMQSAPYAEGIAWWQSLSSDYSQIQMQEYGMTDAGIQLHTIILSKESKKLSDLSKTDKTIILINNAIHPGEPDGVDASMMLYRDLANTESTLLDSCILVCIPYYNIGGAINRNSTTRANQDGPEEYGFRGNAQNLDLNRDFVKCDSRNAESFAKLLQLIDPDMYIETHVSNGADYQYTMTYLSTQPDKLGGEMDKQLRTRMIPGIKRKMKAKDNEIVPYVNHWGGPLKNSYATFYDSPRYSSGLTTLHNIYGFITETHMLKPFKQRVYATYDYLLSSLEYAHEQSSEIQRTRNAQKQSVAAAKRLPIDWAVDNFDFMQMEFKGYEYAYKKSKVTGEDRLYYDRTKPITKSMFYRHAMLATKHKDKPTAYLLRRGFTAVEDRLRWNGVQLIELKKDTSMRVASYIIEDYETVKTPYEKHYLHSQTKARLDTITWTFRKGDYLIPMGTDKDRFILEMLEPEGPDSYFNWNFFDAVLQQKEHYSAYVFEDKAAAILEENPALRQELELKKRQDEDFNKNASAQLEWVYTHSSHYEIEHNRLPVFKTL